MGRPKKNLVKLTKAKRGTPMILDKKINHHLEQLSKSKRGRPKKDKLNYFRGYDGELHPELPKEFAEQRKIDEALIERTKDRVLEELKAEELHKHNEILGLKLEKKFKARAFRKKVFKESISYLNFCLLGFFIGTLLIVSNPNYQMSINMTNFRVMLLIGCSLGVFTTLGNMQLNKGDTNATK